MYIYHVINDLAKYFNFVSRPTRKSLLIFKRTLCLIVGCYILIFALTTSEGFSDPIFCLSKLKFTHSNLLFLVVIVCVWPKNFRAKLHTGKISS